MIRLRWLLLLAGSLILACNSQKGNLENLCRDYVRLERTIVEAKRAGRSRSELEKPIAEYKRICSEMKKYEEEKIYQALKRIPNSGYGQ